MEGAWEDVIKLDEFTYAAQDQKQKHLALFASLLEALVLIVETPAWRALWRIWSETREHGARRRQTLGRRTPQLSSIMT